MSVIKIIHNFLFVAEAMMCAYTIFDLVYKKSKYKNGEIKEIKNTKYMVMIILITLVFVIHGYMRNIV